MKVNWIMKLGVCISTFFLSVCSIVAQNSNFINYGVEEGIVMSQIEALAQDDNGNLWIGTIGGLSKYNGVSFVNFTQKDSLAEDWVTCAYKDKTGNLWFGHWGGGLTMLDPKTVVFTDKKIETYSKYKLITSLTEDLDGVIWVGTDAGGLFKHNPVDQSNQAFDLGTDVHHVTSVFSDKKGILWVGTDAGVVFFDTKAGKIKGKLTVESGLSSNLITSILPAFEKEIWLGTANTGIIRLLVSDTYNHEGTSGLTIEYFTIFEGLPSNNIKTLYQDASKVVWIGARDNGIVQFIPKTKNESGEMYEGDLNLFSNKFEMKYYHANAFLQDREGNIWVGTEIGLNKYMGELFRLYNHNEGLVNNLVWTILEDSKGNVWFGTSEGLSRFTFSTKGNIKQFNNPIVKNFTESDGLSENIIISLLEDTRGNIWIGSENNGLCVMSADGKIVKKITTLNGLPDNKIFSLCEDAEGNIWLGTRKGASKINAEFNVTNYTEEDGLGGEKVYKIFKDSRNELWFAILGGELTKYNGKEFESFGDGQGLTPKFITCIAEDNNKNLWFGAYGEGLIKYDRRAFSYLTINDGMSSNSPHFITCDSENNLWIGMNVGIEKYDQRSENFVLYARKEGFLGLETNENAVAQSKEGYLWFGTIKGAVKFDPTKDRKNSVEPLTFITGFEMFLQDVENMTKNSFSYDENYFTFNVLGISLSNPKEVRYMYYLEGFDEDWTPATKTSYITYSNLSPGNYTFKVKACNNHDLWNKNPIIYSFSISPPFWKTWWFYTLLGIVFIVLLISYIKIRERKLKKRQEFLESEVEKRTDELRKEKEVVVKQNDNIKESLGYAKRIQEAILVPMESIKKSFKDSFILYRPKDIVSGDFYWMHNTGSEILIAAVDCTGHGVPGAFMSIIGNNLLNKVVKEQRITNPSNILETLSKEVSVALRQTTEGSVKDGMDIVICSINITQKKLVFAGAYNPLYLVRNSEVVEMKGDKIPIGEARSKFEDKFQNYELELKDDDSLYIFSDGFADQKGGPKGKKFFYPPFRKLLIDIHKMPMEKQRDELEKTIVKWKGNHEQYDDMLIFGVKI